MIKYLQAFNDRHKWQNKHSAITYNLSVSDNGLRLEAIFVDTDTVQKLNISDSKSLIISFNDLQQLKFDVIALREKELYKIFLSEIVKAKANIIYTKELELLALEKDIESWKNKLNFGEINNA